MKILSVDQMRQVEEASVAAGVPASTLMEKAGLEAARFCSSLLSPTAGSWVLALVGPGNNGGDALVAARQLQRWGARVTAYPVSGRPADDPNLAEAVRRGVTLVSAADDPNGAILQSELESCSLVLDGVLGTGRARPLEGVILQVMLSLGRARGSRRALTVVALDVPTGIDADSGEVDPACPGADHTIAFGYPKMGHYRLPGADMRGELHIVDIGVPPGLDTGISTELLTEELTAGGLPQRPSVSHKGTFGHTLVVAGSGRYVGAACLASEAAARVGSGMVTLAAPECIYPQLAAKLTEVIQRPVLSDVQGRFHADAAPSVRETASVCSAMVLGCGFGSSPGLVELVKQVLLQPPQPSIPVVVDADGLNNLAKIDNWWEAVSYPMVLTPHPGEMSTLAGVPVSQVQARREDIALEMAERWGQTVVLKGAYTVIASPDGCCTISPFANPALASGGTGDVLAGMIAGLMAQGAGPVDAACCGVYLHAAVGEDLRKVMGDAGVLASDMLPRLPGAMQKLRMR